MGEIGPKYRFLTIDRQPEDRIGDKVCTAGVSPYMVEKMHFPESVYIGTEVPITVCIGDLEYLRGLIGCELPHPYGWGFLVHRFYQNLRRSSKTFGFWDTQIFDLRLLSIQTVPALHTFYLKSHPQEQEKRLEPSSFTCENVPFSRCSKTKGF
jgi:hypothetical protein